MVSLNGVRDEVDVPDFYAGKCVFVTGGTGFLGKVLIEKLLSSCTQIDKIYLLIRHKANVSPEQRINEITDSVVFNVLQSARPSYLKKLIPIIGDLSVPGLGLNVHDHQVLIDNVSIVFHVAASVKFNEPLRTAVAIHVEGTREILNICHQLKRIDAVVHVSTAYTNTDEMIVEEKVYPPPAPIEEVYKFINKFGDNAEETSKFIGSRPNTYTYTKALAEHMVAMECSGLPTAVMRPSIILSTLKHPFPGWIENWNGPTALLSAAQNGILRCVRAEGSFVADMIPVDIVANQCIVAATRCKGSQDLKVYNCCSGSRNPITWSTISDNFVKSGIRQGIKGLPFPRLFLINGFLCSLMSFILHSIPDLLLDFCLMISLRKTKYRKLRRKLNILQDTLYFFTTHQWKFQDDNLKFLINSLSLADRKEFFCDPADVDWVKFIDKYSEGTQEYLMKKKTR